jgi:hypothetical protein
MNMWAYSTIATVSTTSQPSSSTSSSTTTITPQLRYQIRYQHQLSLFVIIPLYRKSNLLEINCHITAVI